MSKPGAARDRVEQCTRAGVLRALVEVRGRAVFHDVAVVQHHDLVPDVPDDGQRRSAAIRLSSSLGDALRASTLAAPACSKETESVSSGTSTTTVDSLLST
jgi:hypothetical protein